MIDSERTMNTLHKTCSRLLAPALLACFTATPLLPARADERGKENLLEGNAYVQLSDSTRMLLLGAAAVATPYSNAQLGANLDIALEPLFGPLLREADWARMRNMWTRLGYEVLASNRDGSSRPAERRGIGELTVRVALPYELWLVNRARLELRDIGEQFSSRYRLRIGVERIFTVNDMELIPYSQAETFYDTRYGTWNRQLYQIGMNIVFTNNWSLEPYIARQYDSMSPPDNLDRFGLVFKHYQ